MIIPIWVLTRAATLGHRLLSFFFAPVPFVYFVFCCFELLTELNTNIFALIGCFCGSQINQPRGI